MRKSMYKLLKELFPTIEVYESGSMDDPTPNTKRFIVVRMVGKPVSLGAPSTLRDKVCEIWVHDAPGSYEWIDTVLLAVESRLEEVEHYSANNLDSIAAATFESSSTDLFDDGYKTITRYTRHRLVGRGI